jgi:hypothetical protein
MFGVTTDLYRAVLGEPLLGSEVMLPTEKAPPLVVWLAESAAEEGGMVFGD